MSEDSEALSLEKLLAAQVLMALLELGEGHVAMVNQVVQRAKEAEKTIKTHGNDNDVAYRLLGLFAQTYSLEGRPMEETFAAWKGCLFGYTLRRMIENEEIVL